MVETTGDVTMKVGVMIGIFLLGIMGGSMPKVVSDKNETLLSILNCGSGGVLLAAGFMHLLPDAAEDLRDVSEKAGFPFAYLCTSCGFLFILCVEELAVSYQQRGATDEHQSNDLQNAMAATSEVFQKRQSLVSLDRSSLNLFRRASTTGDLDEPLIRRRSSVRSASHEEFVAAGADVSRHPPSYQHDHEHGHGHGLGEVKHEEGGHGHSHGDVNTVFNSVSSGGSLLSASVLFLALVMHSILEGLGFGTIKGLQAGILVAICVHKVLAAFSLGSSLIQAGVSSKRYSQIIIAFSAVTPVGIALGIAISELADSEVSAYFTALAAGTFIYVSTTEIIPSELAKPDNKEWKLLCLMTGYGLMAALALWV